MTNEIAGIKALIRDVLSDARNLVRQEIALARVEAKEQVGEAKSIGITLGAAAVLALAGVVLVAAAIGAAAADLFGIPLWASYAGVAVLLAAIAFILASSGRRQIAATEVLPKTKASLRENIAWIQSKYSSR